MSVKGNYRHCLKRAEDLSGITPAPMDLHAVCGRLSLKPIKEKNRELCKDIWKVRDKSYLSFHTQSSQQIMSLTHYHRCTL